MGEFQHGFCGCFDDITLCLITYFVPCFTAGKNAEAVGDNCFLVGTCYALIPILGLIMAAKTRGKIREAKGIVVSRPILSNHFKTNYRPFIS